MLLVHVGFTITSITKTKEMYTKALASLGYVVIMEGPGYVSFGKNGATVLWLGEPSERHPTVAKDIHVAFLASSKEEVDTFYKAGLEAGFIDNGAPGIREQYAPNYYAAFLLDADGNNIEALFFV